jgi:hypothetical protein
VTIDFLPLRGLNIGELVGGSSDDGPIAIVQLEKIVGCGASNIGCGYPPGRGGGEAWAWVLAKRVEVDVVSKLNEVV